MAQHGVDADTVPVSIDRDHDRGPQRGGRRHVIAATYLRRKRERETLQRKLDLAYAHAEINRIHLQDEEQEWDPAAAEFMAQRLGTIHTEAGNTPVWSGKRHGNGYDDDTGSERSLLLLNNKGIYSEGLFLNLDRTRGGVPVAAEIMSVLAQVGGQEMNPDSAEFMAQRLGIIQTEAGTPLLGAARGMVIETAMTQGMRYLYFRCTIKEFMLRSFSSIWIGRAVVFLLHQKSWQDKSKLVDKNWTLM